MGYYSNDDEFSTDGCGKRILIFLLVIFAIVFSFSEMGHWITVDSAMERFQDITGSNNIVIIRHSNMTPFVGDPNNATFELLIDGKRASAICTSGTFSEMVCTIYYYQGD